ncbi:hypothetical protein FRC06_009820, partial [Ceratobasidium sp. 370]
RPLLDHTKTHLRTTTPLLLVKTWACRLLSLHVPCPTMSTCRLPPSVLVPTRAATHLAMKTPVGGIHLHVTRTPVAGISSPRPLLVALTLAAVRTRPLVVRALAVRTPSLLVAEPPPVATAMAKDPMWPTAPMLPQPPHPSRPPHVPLLTSESSLPRRPRLWPWPRRASLRPPQSGRRLARLPRRMRTWTRRMRTWTRRKRKRTRMRLVPTKTPTRTMALTWTRT